MKDLYALARHSVAGLLTLLALTLLLGVAYPLAVTGVAPVAMPWQANGSLVDADGNHVTDPRRPSARRWSASSGDDPALFVPRASAAGEGYDLLNTYGSNLGPENPDLVAAVEERRTEVAEREGVDPATCRPTP